MGVYTLNIVGESYRQEEIKRCQEGELLVLKREPNNKYDPNAVAVLRENGKQIRYISRDDAVWVARIMVDGDEVTARIRMITGGTIDKPSYGVVIDINTTPGGEWEENDAIVDEALKNEALGRTVSRETNAEKKKNRKGLWNWIFGG